MEDFQPGNDVMILDDPRFPRLAGLHATYQSVTEGGFVVLQVGTTGVVTLTVPGDCICHAEQQACAACLNPFWRAVGTATLYCGACQTQAEEELDEMAVGEDDLPI